MRSKRLAMTKPCFKINEEIKYPIITPNRVPKINTEIRAMVNDISPKDSN